MSEAAEKVTMDVVVHKANIPVRSGESLDKFISKLSEASRTHCEKKFALSREAGDYCWMIEAFSGSVIMSVDKRKMSRKMFAMSYSRDGQSGAFTFGDAIEVERKTSFAPVKPTQALAQTQVSKAEVKPVNKAVEQLDISKGERAVFGNERSQWVQTSKSFWGGINI